MKVVGWGDGVVGMGYEIFPNNSSALHLGIVDRD